MAQKEVVKATVLVGWLDRVFATVWAVLVVFGDGLPAGPTDVLAGFVGDKGPFGFLEFLPGFPEQTHYRRPRGQSE